MLPQNNKVDKFKFGAYLRGLRKEVKGLSLRKAAFKSQVSSGYISQAERGIRDIPSPDILKKLAPVYKISYEELCDEIKNLPDNMKWNYNTKININNGKRSVYINEQIVNIWGFCQIIKNWHNKSICCYWHALEIIFYIGNIIPCKPQYAAANKKNIRNNR